MAREKTQINEIDNISAPQVTFSKRRKGLFKKAKKSSVLCDADVALIIEFSSSSMKEIFEKQDLHSNNLEKLKQPSLDLQNEGITIQLVEDSNYSRLSTEVAERSDQLRYTREEELQELTIEEFQKLERVLETGLSCVIKKKDEKIMKEINRLHQKRMQLMEENELLKLQVETAAAETENIVEEEDQSTESVTNACNSSSDSSDTSLKLG